MSPNALATPCAQPGCPELTHHRYCAEHSTQSGHYDYRAPRGVTDEIGGVLKQHTNLKVSNQ